MEKHQLQTIEDIEMELVKMHGGIENVEAVKEFPAGEIIDSGAVDHSSDSDYEPPVSLDNSFNGKNNTGICVSFINFVIWAIQNDCG
jgi:hypothetical protein